MIGGWEWAALGKLIQELLESEAGAATADQVRRSGVAGAKSLWQKMEWDSAEASYRQRLLQFLGTTRLLGNPKPLSIDQLYTDLFVYNNLSALRRSAVLVDPREDGRASHEHSSLKRQQASEVVGTGENLYLLGHPGAGKTTFLRYLAIRACRGLLAQVPIYLQLRDLVQPPLWPWEPLTKPEDRQHQYRALIWASMLNEFDVCAFPEKERFLTALLKSGRALVLIDGLDEIPSDDGFRRAVIASVLELQRRYPKIQICVTCRIAASEYTFEHFRYAEVAPFTEEQQAGVIRKWFVDDRAKQQQLLTAWKLPRSAPLRDLGRTPLLLALICLAFDDLGELPDRHVDLYREALDALFKRWDSSRSISRDPFYEGLSPHRREQLAQELAAQLFEKDKITFTSVDVQEIVARWFRRLPEGGGRPVNIRSDEVLEHIEAQHGIVIQRARGTYSFAHLTIQEFLFARSICEGHPSRTLEELARHRSSDPRWREVVVFAAGLLQDGLPFLDTLVRAVAKVLGIPGPLRSLFSAINERYRAGNRAAAGDDGQEIQEHSANSPLRLSGELVARLDGLPWAGEAHALRQKAALLRQWLRDLHAVGGVGIGELAAESSELAKYLQAVHLVVDCAAVATCQDRGRVILPLFGSARM